MERHFFSREDRAIGNVSRHPRRSVRHHSCTDCRPQTIGADQCRALERLTIFGISHYPVTVVFKAHHLLRGHQSNQRRVLASQQKHSMNVSPMNQRIGITKSVAKFLTQRDARDLFGGNAVHHQEALGKHGRGVDLIRDTQPVKHLKGIRSKLNPSPDLLELARLLKQADAESMAA